VNKRPKALNEKLAEISDENDEKIISALDKIEATVNKDKFKATISTVAKIACVHPNTVRNRLWVKSRLKVIKNRRQQLIDSNNDCNESSTKAAIEDALRTRIRALLEQNAMLYQEVLGTIAEIKKKDNELDVLKRRIKIKNAN